MDVDAWVRQQKKKGKSKKDVLEALYMQGYGKEINWAVRKAYFNKKPFIILGIMLVIAAAVFGVLYATSLPTATEKNEYEQLLSNVQSAYHPDSMSLKPSMYAGKESFVQRWNVGNADLIATLANEENGNPYLHSIAVVLPTTLTDTQAREQLQQRFVPEIPTLECINVDSIRTCKHYDVLQDFGFASLSDYERGRSILVYCQNTPSRDCLI